LVHLERHEEDLPEALLDSDTEAYLPSIVLTELWIGVELASGRRRDARRARVHELIAATSPLKSRNF